MLGFKTVKPLFASARMVRYLGLAACLLCAAIVRADVINVRTHGAVGDGRTPDTVAIQAAIDAASRAGGGIVVVPAGVFLTGSIELRSHVTLRIEDGALLQGLGPVDGAYPVHQVMPTPRLDTAGAFAAGASPPQVSALIFARGQRNIAVEGSGIVDGNGAVFPISGIRPSILCFIQCEDVRIEDVTTRSSAFWTQHYVQCTRVQIDRVRVHSHLPDRNNDGIDLVECHQVRLADSVIIADDDAICLKSNLSPGHGTRDILVENCTVYGRKSAVKIGTESLGPFENITVRNLTAYGTRGVNLYSVDGAQIRNVLVENVVIRDGYAAILVHVGDRLLFGLNEISGPKSPGGISNVTIRNLDATMAAKSFRDILSSHGVTLFGPVHDQVMPVSENFISGFRDHQVSNVILQNITLRGLPGGGTRADIIDRVPENSSRYPLHGMFGRLPAWALYIRNANNVAIDNLVVEAAVPDDRPALLCDGVERFRLGFAVNAGGEFTKIERKGSARQAP
jgi:hypothetical protein